MKYEQIINQEIRKIAEHLIKISIDNDHLPTSLLGGKMGISIFLFELYRFNNDKRYLDSCISNVSVVIESLSLKPLTHTHCDGFSGIMLGLHYLSSHGIRFLDEESEQEIDEFIFQFAIKDINTNNYDLLHGGVGACLYFLSKPTNSIIKAYLEKLLLLLVSKCVTTPDGTTWVDTFTKNSKAVKGSVVNLGMAHGVPSIIAILSKYLDSALRTDICFPLLKSTVDWLIANKLVNSAQGIYGCSIPNARSDYYSPLGWCYGDLGVLPCFIMANKHLKEPYLVNHITEISEKLQKRNDIELSGKISPYLCHGTAGLAHILQQIYLYNQNNDYLRYSEKWILESIHLIHGILDKEDQSKQLGILDGLSGIGLALLSFISPSQNSWNQFLLMS